MQNGVATKSMPKKMVDTYVYNKLMGLSPGQLLLTVYDVAITSCQQKDYSKASRAISELISSLDFEHKEISLGLFRLYQYILEQIRKKNYVEVIDLLKELRDTWATAIKNMK